MVGAAHDFCLRRFGIGCDDEAGSDTGCGGSASASGGAGATSSSLAPMLLLTFKTGKVTLLTQSLMPTPFAATSTNLCEEHTNFNVYLGGAGGGAATCPSARVEKTLFSTIVGAAGGANRNLDCFKIFFFRHRPDSHR